MPRAETLSLELLRTFSTMIDCACDATHAAERLNINQPSMSKRLGPLQHSGRLLDRPWLQRKGKRWELTREGAMVAPVVRRILTEFDKLREFAPGTQDAGEQVRFACGQHDVQSFVRHALLAFRKKHPAIGLRISTQRGEDRITSVDSGAIDLATVTHDDFRIRQVARNSLTIEVLKTDPLVVVCAKSSPWTRAVERLSKRKASLEMLADVPLILPDRSSGVRKTIDDALSERDLHGRLNVPLEIGGWSTILLYVAQKLGVGVVKEAAIENRSRFVVRVLDRNLYDPVETKLIFRAKRPGEKSSLSDAAYAWRGVLREMASRNSKLT